MVREGHPQAVSIEVRCIVPPLDAQVDDEGLALAVHQTEEALHLGHGVAEKALRASGGETHCNNL